MQRSIPVLCETCSSVLGIVTAPSRETLEHILANTPYVSLVRFIPPDFAERMMRQCVIECLSCLKEESDHAGKTKVHTAPLARSQESHRDKGKR